MTAYFTEPMGDEFRKALEEAYKQIEEDAAVNSKSRPNREKKAKQIRKKNKSLTKRKSKDSQISF